MVLSFSLLSFGVSLRLVVIRLFFKKPFPVCGGGIVLNFLLQMSSFFIKILYSFKVKKNSKKLA